MALLPSAPMMNVAKGGPATQAKETIARVFMTSAALAPECFRWANRSELPTPAGPPRTIKPTTASGSEVLTAKRADKAKVRMPHANRGRR